MNRSKLLREIREYGKKNGIEIEVDTRQGKGSHYIVRLGDKKTTVQADINEPRAQRVRKQLGMVD
jgi:hypothetical protein